MTTRSHVLRYWLIALAAAVLVSVLAWVAARSNKVEFRVPFKEADGTVTVVATDGSCDVTVPNNWFPQAPPVPGSSGRWRDPSRAPRGRNGPRATCSRR